MKISTHIFDELKNSTIKIEKLASEKRKELLDTIIRKYIDGSKREIFLWDKFIKYEALNDSMAWSYIKCFINDEECIMFFNQNDDQEMLVIQCGDDLDYILSETYGFEFYITDRSCSYLICFSHHDILYGCGDAETWIIELKSKMKSINV